MNEWKQTAAAQKTGASMRFPRMSALRRVVLASLAVLVLMLGAVSSSFAASQYRYEVQDGDTLDSVAATFGVDPQAIAASSYMPSGDTLTPGQVIVIPEPGQSPSDAAAMAATREGTSPWIYTMYTVQSGETLDGIASAYGLDSKALADFNGISDATNITVGQRLAIPPSRDGQQAQASAQEATASHAADVVVPKVPTYAQSRNLSCEYAAVHIATAAFGNAIPESVLINSIPVTKNPHNGYRGNIDGWWGNTDDYGIYPEALVPVIHDYGYSTDIFYGQ
ncbi:MAG: LysM peptidoglycan-binding domain-containing protein, partial [Thermomicrobiales bacterium]